VWVQRTIVPTSGFVSLGNDVLDEQDVQNALAQQVTTQLEQRVPALSGANTQVRQAVDVVLDEPAFREVFDQAVGETHSQLIDDDDPLTLDLDAMVPIVRNQLPPELAAEVPEQTILGPITVLRRDDAPALWTGVQITKSASVALPIVSVLLLAGAVVLARRNALAVALVGGGIAVVALVLVIVVEVGRSLLGNVSDDPVNQAAFEAGYDVVTGSFVRQTIVLAVVGAVIGLIGVALMLWQPKRTARSSDAVFG
jgi:hypothetical protein